jgi:predicted acyltransferase
MIMVNNPGSWSFVYAPLGHAPWNGLTPTDLVFPFFMFIMGVSMFLSYKKLDFKFSKDSFVKLTRRSVLLFLIGLFIGWLGLSMRQFNALRAENLDFVTQFWQATTDFENLRILGVLQRLALVSFFGTLTILLVRPKRIPFLIGLILVVYWLIIAVTNSYEMSEESIIAIIDRYVLGSTHMYHDTTAAGVNPMFVYVTGAVLGILVGNLGFTLNGEFIAFKTYIFNDILQPTLGDYPGSLALALVFVSICWAVGHVFYKKKIFIKL